ncbi:23S rRNA (adenine(2503)-C(2))-methyltransferase RlmN [Geothrix sp.]|jgi:23S rRNA (adenine2503-C2)-methyltransferase|uniref:23S rRNA (adenine(2503)-C(2))-methyltransferase RlmN n=1 Tax=Geothrix sp. TaxID=1962974 RepID=UPI0025C2C183|nr:23S rRNA (adenine(2503)-C(2))-methyltransferase RlmN [Geothrix sp.]
MAQPWDLPAPEAGSAPRPNAAGLDLAALKALVASFGEPAWRGAQLFEGLYRQRWTRWEQFTHLPQALRTRLTAEVDLAWPAIVQSLPSSDGSTKHVFELADGKQVEGVHMPYVVRGSGLRPTPPEPPRPGQAEPDPGLSVRGSGLRPTPPEPPRPGQAEPDPGLSVRGSGLRPTPPEPGSEDLDRVTLCLSSQVGCAMGCTFCATGQMGIIRNLSAAEIVGQVVAMLNHHGHSAERPVNLVFMGMGEPLHNLDHVMTAFGPLTDPKGLAIPPRRITLSTSGLVSGIERLGAFARRPRLALSLNATTDIHRSLIMPVNRVWNLEALATALAAFPLQSGERITLEYVLLKGVTDSLEDGRRLAAFARRFPAKINLIPFNPHEGSGFEPPEESRIGALCRLLSDAGLPVSVRRSRGQDVAGACGQLVREGQGRHPKPR